MRHSPHLRLQQRLSGRHQAWVYVTAGAVALSGVGWLVCHYLLPRPEYGARPAEGWWLRVHGAALLGFLVAFGAALPIHAVYGWRHRMNRGSGLAVVIGTAFLAASGYGLYYLVDEALRARVSLAHWIVGLALIGALPLHVALGRRTRLLERPEAHPPRPGQAHHHHHHARPG